MFISLFSKNQIIMNQLKCLNFHTQIVVYEKETWTWTINLKKKLQRYCQHEQLVYHHHYLIQDPFMIE